MPNNNNNNNIPKSLVPHNDPMGTAINDFHLKKQRGKLMAESSISEPDEMEVSYLFRNYHNMPKIEQVALDNCSGKVLDVGAAAGSHALYLQTKKQKVTAIDISTLSVQVAKARGVEDAELANFFSYTGQKFDTLLFMMNGIGIVGALEMLPLFFVKCKELLNPKGQVLLDSSDIVYMFQNEDGSMDVDLNSIYYGELQYKMRYDNIEGDWFPWLFIDFDRLSSAANKAGFKCELLQKGEHYDYLVRLTPQIIK